MFAERLTSTESLMKSLVTSLTLALLATASGIAAPKIGAPAPTFSLADISGKDRALADYKGKYVVLEWVNHGCPFVQKHYNSGNMQGLQKEFTGKDVVWLSI